MSLDTLTVTNNRISNLPTAILLFVIGFGGRIMLHDYPNFETVMVSIFLASMLLPLSMSFVVTISIIFLSDLYLGYFGTSKIIIFTYSGFLLVSLITSRFKDQIKGNYNSNTVYKFSATGIIFAGIYDVWTNFGVFLLSYELTLENLILVYILGIPFMIYHLLSSIVTFSLLGFPLYYLFTINNKNDYKIPTRKESNS
ncbi:MAG: hypothetical protein CMA32_01765 [Euryarchaeota archaeon]|nr:hypothetical protein [Euryarchaeota archaeon]|tara:strand:+ start:645 stop:1238 length:594 start_codon:yes stop_codon:yes gene_type:complete